MIPKNDLPGPHKILGDPSLKDNYVITDSLNMDSRQGSNRLLINQMFVFRIDLPCYPTPWSDGLVLELESLVMIDPVIVL